METRANYALIGLFTLAVILAGFGFVYWFNNENGGAERAFYRIKFERSVSGLRTGASVLFNGLRVGEVTTLRLDPADPNQVYAVVAVDKATPVREDTRIGLSFQGLTGVASVSLMGGSVSSPAVKGVPAEAFKVAGDAKLPLLVADPAASRDLIEAARETLQHADAILVDNSAALKSAIANLDTFTASLSRNAGKIDDILAGVENMVGGKNGGGELQKATQSLTALAESLEKRAGEITAGVNRLTASSTREIQALSADGRRTLGTVDRAVKNLDDNPSRILFGGRGTSVREYNRR